MRQFIPMTDEMLYSAGGPPGRLVPYRAGLDCWHALAEPPCATPHDLGQPSVRRDATASPDTTALSAFPTAPAA